MSSEQAIQAEIIVKGKTAPRLTPEHIDAVIRSKHFFTALDGVDGYYRGGPEAQGVADAARLGCLTFCVLVLDNGFIVTGESSAVSSENFDFEICKKVAFEKARNKIWELEGYLLRERQDEAGYTL